MAIERGGIAIVAPAQDAHARAVCDRLTALGAAPVWLDTEQFPGELCISLGEDLLDIHIGGRHLAPASVYVRDLALSPTSSSRLGAELATDWRLGMVALRERSELLLSILHRWERAGAHLYNPLSAFPRITKPYQLALLAEAGLPVPPTRWTNDPDVVRSFASSRRVAYKPVAGGAATQELALRDLTPERLSSLRTAPVCFQELLPGQDLRVYVIDGAIAASIAIDSDALDFRGHERGMSAFPLDDDLRRICLRATDVLGLRFTGMDLKLDARGAPQILELNPSPMFLGFDQRAGTDVLGALCTALLATAATAAHTLDPSARARCCG